MSVHVIYTLLGMGALMHSTPWLMQVAQLLGGLYLFYLGVVFIRQAGRMAEGTGRSRPGRPPPRRAVRCRWPVMYPS